MLTTTKNTLLNKVLQVEVALYEAVDESEKIHVESWAKIPALDSNTLLIIQRNIESIKKQLKKL